MAAIAARNALSTLTAAMGPPTRVLYSGGSILASFPCDPAALDMALSNAAAAVEHAVDVPLSGSRRAIRIGAMGSVHFHAEIRPGADQATVRIFSPPPGSRSPEAWTTSHNLADAAFDVSGDPHQALLSYISAKLMDEPGGAQRMASDLARLLSDYMRMQLPSREIHGLRFD